MHAALLALALAAAADASPPQWEDPARELEAAAEGALDVCEALAVPLGLIPGVGDVIDLVAGWLCILPAALAVDYVAVHHGGKDSRLWQSMLAVGAAKVVGGVVELPVLVLGVGSVVVYGLAASAAIAATGTPVFIPAAVGGGILLGYVAFELWRTAHDRVPGLVFSTVFSLAAKDFDDAEHAAQARERALVKPPLPQPFGFLSMCAGASVLDVDTEPVHFVPVAGPFAKADARSALAKERMRRIGRDVIGDPPKDLATMDAIEDALGGTKAWLQASGQVLLFGGVGVAGLSAVGAAYVLARGEQPPPVDVIAIVGVAGMGVGVGLIVLSKVTDVVRPALLPTAYLLAPPLDVE